MTVTTTALLDPNPTGLALQVQCPACAALPRRLCVNVRGRATAAPHPARQRAAAGLPPLPRTGLPPGPDEYGTDDEDDAA